MAQEIETRAQKSHRPAGPLPGLQGPSADPAVHGWRAVIDSVQEQAGNHYLSDIAAQGPQSAWDVQVYHLLWLAHETGENTSAYLPWNAPPSWNDQVAPLYRVLLSQYLSEVDLPSAEAPSLGLGAADVLGPSMMTELGLDGASSEAGFAPAVEAPAPIDATVARDAEQDRDTGPGFIEWFERMLRAAGSGRPLTQQQAALVEEVHGRRFPEARVHEGAAARAASRAIGARAFALGSDIYVGQEGLEGEAGAEILVHEMTHVAQAAQGRLPSPEGQGLEVSSPSEPFEQEARARGREGRALFRARDAAGRWGIDLDEAPDSRGQLILDHLAATLEQADDAPPAEVVRGGVRAFSPPPSGGPVAAGSDLMRWLRSRRRGPFAGSRPRLDRLRAMV